MTSVKVLKRAASRGVLLGPLHRKIEHSAWLETVKDNARRHGLHWVADRLLLVIDLAATDAQPFVLAFYTTLKGEGEGGEERIMGLVRMPYNPDCYGWMSPRMDYLIEQMMPERKHVDAANAALRDRRYRVAKAKDDSQAERDALAKFAAKHHPDLGSALASGILPFIGEAEGKLYGLEGVDQVTQGLSNAHDRVISVHNPKKAPAQRRSS